MSNLAITDLRFNNKIQDQKGLIYTIIGYEPNQVLLMDQQAVPGYLSIEFIFGIPITEEWLIRMGFYKAYNGCYDHSDIDPRLKISDYGFQFYYMDDAESTLYPINLLHQLQNQVYFAFGIELTIK